MSTYNICIYGQIRKIFTCYSLLSRPTPPDKARFFYLKVSIFFLFLHENICCGYSSEALHRGASNEYPQHMYSWRNQKNIIWLPHLTKYLKPYQPSTCCISMAAFNIFKHFYFFIFPCKTGYTTLRRQFTC